MKVSDINAPPAKSCCYKESVVKGAVFCGECGKPLLRCMASEECGGLVGPDGRCTVCVRPQLFLDQGAVKDVTVGGALVLPLLFRNDGTTGRPLIIEKVWVREGDGERVEVELPWDRLEPGEIMPLRVQTEPLSHAGQKLVEISFLAATRYRWRQEDFAFVASMELGSSKEQTGGIVINQTLNAEQGATIYSPNRLEDIGLGGLGQVAALSQAVPLQMIRATKLERQLGIRGYDGGDVVQRDATFIWRGFGEGEAPADGPITTPDSLLAMGRSLLRTRGGEGDVRLIVRNASGEEDTDVAAMVSRRHIELFIRNGRLGLRATGGAGVRVNNEALGRDAERDLANGDVISVLPLRADAITLEIGMRGHHGEIDQIVVTRKPGTSGGAQR